MRRRGLSLLHTAAGYPRSSILHTNPAHLAPPTPPRHHYLSHTRSLCAQGRYLSGMASNSSVGTRDPNMFVVDRTSTTRGVRISMPTREDHGADNHESNTNKKRKNQAASASPPKATESTATTTETSTDDAIPETVLQYERQMRKIQAANRAGAPVTAEEHLRVIYDDEHIVVADKPSGVLCVPGVNKNPSLLTVVYEMYGCESNVMDSMICHRLDMDTSGLVVFAKTNAALKSMHEIFRERQVSKSYEALLCGHVQYDNGVIDLPLQRDHRHPPFMRVSTPQSEEAAAQAVKDLKSHGWKKLVMKRPKQSQTEFQVLSREVYCGKIP